MPVMGRGTGAGRVKGAAVVTSATAGQRDRGRPTPGVAAVRAGCEAGVRCRLGRVVRVGCASAAGPHGTGAAPGRPPAARL